MDESILDVSAAAKSMPRVTKPIPSYLRLHTEELPAPPPDFAAGGHFEALRRAFHLATGWNLHYLRRGPVGQQLDLLWSAPVNPGDGTAPGLLRIEPAGPHEAALAPAIELEAAAALAQCLALWMGDQMRLERALWQREAELAAGVPVTASRHDAARLAQRLQAAVKSAADAVDCPRAALYLLDADTTVLKLRSAWGLPTSRLTDPPRPLAGAVADLEALLGHAVVLEDAELLARWNPPEHSASGACVPVSTASTPLGTLWVFDDQRRGFTDRQTNLLEVVAGRLAAELEREMLLVEGVEGARLKRHMAAAAATQQNLVPRFAPLVDGWEVAGRSESLHDVGGEFLDWFVLPDGRLVLALGDCREPGFNASLLASALRAALRAHTERLASPAALLGAMNRSAWAASAGDQAASLFYGVIRPATGAMQFASAGEPLALHVRGRRIRSLLKPRPLLGAEPTLAARSQRLAWQAGDLLVVVTDGIRDAVDSQGRVWGAAGLKNVLAEADQADARTLCDLVWDRLEAHTDGRHTDDRSVLVVRRLGH